MFTKVDYLLIFSPLSSSLVKYTIKEKECQTDIPLKKSMLHNNTAESTKLFEKVAIHAVCHVLYYLKTHKNSAIVTKTGNVSCERCQDSVYPNSGNNIANTVSVTILQMVVITTVPAPMASSWLNCVASTEVVAAVGLAA